MVSGWTPWNRRQSPPAGGPGLPARLAQRVQLGGQQNTARRPAGANLATAWVLESFGAVSGAKSVVDRTHRTAQRQSAASLRCFSFRPCSGTFSSITTSPAFRAEAGLPVGHRRTGLFSSTARPGGQPPETAVFRLGFAFRSGGPGGSSGSRRHLYRAMDQTARRGCECRRRSRRFSPARSCPRGSARVYGLAGQSFQSVVWPFWNFK